MTAFPETPPTPLPLAGREAARDTEPPANRAARRGHGKKKGPAPHGGGKVQGSRFGGPAPRRYQQRKHG